MDTCTLRILELVPELSEVPLEGVDTEVAKGDQARLTLQNPNDQLPGDSWEGGGLDKRLSRSDDLDPVLEGWMNGEGNEVVLNAHKGKNLLRDKF